MSTQAAEHDLDDLDFDAGPCVDEADYARIMQRIGIDGDETVTQVSAFNSSL